MRELYRRMTPAQKMRRVMDLGATTDALARCHLRESHPGATERELTLRVAARRFDADTMIRVFGWDERDGRTSR